MRMCNDVNGTYHEHEQHEPFRVGLSTWNEGTYASGVFSSLKGRISTLNEGILSIMYYSQALNRRGKENVSGQ